MCALNWTRKMILTVNKQLNLEDWVQRKWVFSSVSTKSSSILNTDQEHIGQDTVKHVVDGEFQRAFTYKLIVCVDSTPLSA